VLTFNNKVQTFPSNLIAGMFNFTTRQFFEAPEGDRAVPSVDLR
jgi:LemA protein